MVISTNLILIHFRWADRISMRLELYGCDYIPDVLHFNGKSLIRRGLSKFPVNSLRDTFRFRFKTNKENGIILYSRGSQGDYISLQLAENRLLLNMKLGGNRETSIMLGSLLDDNIYHDVEISRLVVMTYEKCLFWRKYFNNK